MPLATAGYEIKKTTSSNRKTKRLFACNNRQLSGAVADINVDGTPNCDSRLALLTIIIVQDVAVSLNICGRNKIDQKV